MADEKTNPSPQVRTRRSSFAGETFANLFGGTRGSMSRPAAEASGNSGNSSQQQSMQSHQGPITSAAAQAQRRRLSLTTLGLSGSPNQSSPFGSYSGRRDSYASGNSESIDESAIEDDSVPSASNPPPQTPLGRRLSFGAKALRDARTGGNTPPGHNGSSEGFNWSDNFRTRAERTSVASAGVNSGFLSGGSGSPRTYHGRAQSVSVMEQPIREMPKPKEQVRPDHFQERILKGDFYMD